MRVGAAVAAALLLVACGGDAAGRYDAQVDRVRDAVDAGDRDAALASLDQLGIDAFQAHAAGDVTDDELAQLAALIEQARAQVDVELAPPTTEDTGVAPTTTAAPTTSPAPIAADDHDDGGGKGKKGDRKRR